MSRTVMVTDLVRMQTKRLKMPGLARNFEALLRQAREEGWAHEDLLHELLAAEINSREDSSARLTLPRLRGHGVEREAGDQLCWSQSSA